MSLHLQRIYAAGTGGTENSAASLDIPEDGFLVGVQWAAYGSLNADTEYFQAELSFIATHQMSTNDARGMIADIKVRFGLLTSGGGPAGINVYFPFEDLQVSAGERVHLHIVAPAGITSDISAILHLDTRRAIPRRARRRR